MKRILIMTAFFSGILMGCTENKQSKSEDNMQKLELTQEWDKVFPLSDKVNHRKVTFETQYGLTLAADLYEPKDAQGAVEWSICHADGRTWIRDTCLRSLLYR